MNANAAITRIAVAPIFEAKPFFDLFCFIISSFILIFYSYSDLKILSPDTCKVNVYMGCY
jgi:hypothetical protein